MERSYQNGKRIRYYEDRGIKVTELRERRETGEWRARLLIKRNKEMQREEK